MQVRISKSHQTPMDENVRWSSIPSCLLLIVSFSFKKLNLIKCESNRTENSSSFCWEDLLPMIFRYPNKRIISSQDSSCHLHKNQVPMPFLRILHQSVCASYRLVQEDGDERMFWPVTIFRILSLRCPSRSVIVLRYVTPPWKEKCTIEAPTSEIIGSQQQELRYVKKQ